jgi:hypothetical protein
VSEVKASAMFLKNEAAVARGEANAYLDQARRKLEYAGRMEAAAELAAKREAAEASMHEGSSDE